MRSTGISTNERAVALEVSEMFHTLKPVSGNGLGVTTARVLDRGCYESMGRGLRIGHRGFLFRDSPACIPQLAITGSGTDALGLLSI